MSGTPRLALPFLSPGQAQKEVFHNEALQRLDAIVAGAVEQPPLASPPAEPAVGSCYIVAAGATGEWAGKDHFLAARSSAGWRYIAPCDGMTALVRSSGVLAVYRAGSWEVGVLRADRLHVEGQQVVAARQPPIASAAGGATIDAEARATISLILEALRQHGLIAV